MMWRHGIPSWQLRLLGEIEAKYGVMIPMERISTIKKLNDFYQYIKES